MLTLADFIKKYKTEINNRDFGNSEFEKYYGTDLWRGLMTSLIKLGVNPLARLQYIPDGFFENSEIESITIPDNIIGIGPRAFRHCNKLLNVTIGKGLKWVGSEAFCISELRALTVVNYKGTIDKWCEIEFVGGLSQTSSPIQSQTNFYINNAPAKNIDITTATRVKDHAFEFCNSLETVRIGSSVKSIGRDAFSYCRNLTEVIIEEGVLDLGYGAFERCDSLKKINIPDSIKEIKGDTFSSCKSLENLIIGKGIIKIDNEAFYNNPLLKKIDYLGTINNWKNIRIEKGIHTNTGIPKGCIIKCRDGELNLL